VLLIVSAGLICQRTIRIDGQRVDVRVVGSRQPTAVDCRSLQNYPSDDMCSGVRIIYGGDSMVMSFLCDHGGKERNGDTHGGEQASVGMIRLI